MCRSKSGSRSDRPLVHPMERWFLQLEMLQRHLRKSAVGRCGCCIESNGSNIGTCGCEDLVKVDVGVAQFSVGDKGAKEVVVVHAPSLGNPCRVRFNDFAVSIEPADRATIGRGRDDAVSDIK